MFAAAFIALAAAAAAAKADVSPPSYADFTLSATTFDNAGTGATAWTDGGSGGQSGMVHGTCIGAYGASAEVSAGSVAAQQHAMRIAAAAEPRAAGVEGHIALTRYVRFGGFGAHAPRTGTPVLRSLLDAAEARVLGVTLRLWLQSNATVGGACATDRAVLWQLRPGGANAALVSTANAARPGVWPDNSYAMHEYGDDALWGIDEPAWRAALRAALHGAAPNAVRLLASAQFSADAGCTAHIACLSATVRVSLPSAGTIVATVPPLLPAPVPPSTTTTTTTSSTAPATTTTDDTTASVIMTEPPRSAASTVTDTVATTTNTATADGSGMTTAATMPVETPSGAAGHSELEMSATVPEGGGSNAGVIAISFVVVLIVLAVGFACLVATHHERFRVLARRVGIGGGGGGSGGGTSLLPESRRGRRNPRRVQRTFSISHPVRPTRSPPQVGGGGDDSLDDTPTYTTIAIDSSGTYTEHRPQADAIVFTASDAPIPPPLTAADAELRACDEILAGCTQGSGSDEDADESAKHMRAAIGVRAEVARRARVRAEQLTKAARSRKKD